LTKNYAYKQNKYVKNEQN